MPNPLCHFAIHADDCPRAMAFYKSVFSWRFEAWGPPDFWRVLTGQPGVEGALQKRREPVTGTGMRGFECSISVSDVESTTKQIVKHGGQILMPGFLIQGVGTVVKFQDTEGNVACVIQYLPSALETLGGS